MDELEQRWMVARNEIREHYPQLDQDPYLSPSTEEGKRDLLRRYLNAEEGNVAAAEKRMRQTAVFRRVYRCIDFHKPGIARELFSAPGAEMYFAHAGLDKEGNPFLVGRLFMCNGDALNPTNHIRAAILVCERAACQIRPGSSHGGCYILDLRPVHFAATVSATGGGNSNNKGASADQHHHDDDDHGDGKDDPDVHIYQRHAKLKPGLSTLKESMRILTSHYPELLGRVYFYHSPWWFWGVVNVFKLWLPVKTRHKMMFVGKGLTEHSISEMETMIAIEHIPQEFEGKGRSLDGDGFIERAIQYYDQMF